MRRKPSLPLAGLVALLAGVALVGCGTPTAPSPTPTVADTATPEATAPVVVEPGADPTTVATLPGSAFLRVSVTALADGEELRLTLTFDRAATGEARPNPFGDVQTRCRNAVVSQLDSHPGQEPTGVITSKLSVDGDWPDGMTVGVSAGGQIASVGDGRGVAPETDEPGMFGCSVVILTGGEDATTTSLLLGDPAVADRIDLERALGVGLFGFETDAGSAMPVQWRDCVIQLSSSAQRIARENAWTPPAVWGDGCLVGDEGPV
jgi:hypothetical protein